MHPLALQAPVPQTAVRASAMEGLDRTLAQATLRRVEAKEFVFIEGDPTTHVFRVETGAVSLYKVLADGRRQIVGFAYPGDLIGLGAQGEHVMNAQAIKPTRLRCLRLLRLPLVLLVHKKSRLKSAAELWERESIDEPLICLPPTEPMMKNFKLGLRRRQVDWPHSIEASSMGLVTRYVANGYGVGVSLGQTEVVRHPDVRVLPLEGFDPLEMAALWRARP